MNIHQLRQYATVSNTSRCAIVIVMLLLAAIAYISARGFFITRIVS